MDTKEPPDLCAPSALHHSNPVYSVASQHWVHAEQTRWWILYDFLMANSILILAWATIYAGAKSSPVLYVLSIAGFLLSILWLGLSKRANGYVDMYGELGKLAEEKTPAIFGPFSRATKYRSRLPPFKTGWVLLIIPSIFGLVYVSFIYLTWCNP